VPITVKLSERFYQKFGHDLVDEMVNWFADVIKWMFLFWVGNFATTAGIIFALRP
jgi:hypothetical protein